MSFVYFFDFGESGIEGDHMDWSPGLLVCGPGLQGHPPGDGPGPADGGVHQPRPVLPGEEELPQLLQPLLPVLLQGADSDDPQGEGVRDVVYLASRVTRGCQEVLIPVCWFPL